MAQPTSLEFVLGDLFVTSWQSLHMPTPMRPNHDSEPNSLRWPGGLAAGLRYSSLGERIRPITKYIRRYTVLVNGRFTVVSSPAQTRRRRPRWGLVVVPRMAWYGSSSGSNSRRAERSPCTWFKHLTTDQKVPRSSRGGCIYSQVVQFPLTIPSSRSHSSPAGGRVRRAVPGNPPRVTWSLRTHRL